MKTAVFDPSSFFVEEMIRFLEEVGSTQQDRVPHPQSTFMAPLDYRVSVAGECNGPVLLLTAGLHGIEGLAGMHMLSTWLKAGGLRQVREAGASIVMIPCINVWGARSLRRVNEDGTDGNRNYLDFYADGFMPPQNPGYDALHQHLVPTDWTEETRIEADATIDAFIEANGFGAYQAALTGGQYTKPNGLFYGGTRPSWSNIQTRKAYNLWLSRATRIGHIDVHTGLGPNEVGTRLYPVVPQNPMFRRATRWWGEGESPFAGESVSAAVIGHMAGIIAQVAPNAEVTSMALEFGTYPIGRMINTLRAEQVWHNMGNPSEPWGTEVQREMLECFWPSSKHWRLTCQEQFNLSVEQALRGLME